MKKWLQWTETQQMYNILWVSNDKQNKKKVKTTQITFLEFFRPLTHSETDAEKQWNI